MLRNSLNPFVTAVRFSDTEILNLAALKFLTAEHCIWYQIKALRFSFLNQKTDLSYL